MTVQTQVSEADIGKLQVGMPVYFTTLGGQDYRWYSKLDRIEPTPVVTNNVVLYNALFDVPNDSKMLMTQMSTQVFFIASQAKDTLVIPAAAVNFKPRKPGESGEKKWGDQSNWQKRNSDNKPERDDSKSISKGDAKDESKPDAKNSADKTDDKKEANQSSRVNENKWEQSASSGDEKPRHRRGPRKTPGADGAPQPATVQVMNAKGELEERKVMVGISNRVQTQVLEGLNEGETVVVAMRQLDKPKGAPASPMGAGGGVPGGGGPGGGARQMR